MLMNPNANAHSNECSLPVYVGLDYSELAVRVCVMDASGRTLGNRDVSNDADRLDAYVRRFGTLRGAAIEACSGASDLAEQLADRYGWSIHMGHTAFIRQMKHHPDKTDHGDAQLLADLQRVGYLPRVWLAPRAVRHLRTLTRDRFDLTDQRRALKLQIGAILREQRIKRPVGKSWTKRFVHWLEHELQVEDPIRFVIDRKLNQLRWVMQQIALVEAKLREMTADDVTVKRLLEQPGIGEVTAWALRAEVGRFDRFRSGKALSRYCGLSPCNASSGQRQADKGLIDACNKRLRGVLIQMAWSLTMNHPRWQQLAQSMRDRGKPGSVISAAIANRFMRWLWHEMVPRKQVDATGCVD